MNYKEKPVVNELLCFITNKIHVTTKDAIVDICARFYSIEEIHKAIAVLESSSDVRISKRNKGDSTKMITDIYEKLFTLDAAAKSIIFVAVDLSRVPQDSRDSDSLVSTEQLLATIQNMKQMIREIQSQMVTKDQLRDSLNLQPSVNSAPPLTPSAPPLSQESAFTSVVTIPAPSPVAVASVAAPKPDASSSSSSSSMGPRSSHKPSALRSMDSSEYEDVVGRQRSKVKGQQQSSTKSDSAPRRGKKNTVVIGKKVSGGEVSWRGADLTVPRYIGRVALGTTTEDVKSLLIDNGVDVVSLDPLSLKHNRFLSFKLVIKKSQLPLIENPDFWPEGVMVGRWWNGKPTTNE